MVKREGVFFSRKRANDDLGRGREQNRISQAPFSPPLPSPPYTFVHFQLSVHSRIFLVFYLDFPFMEPTINGLA
jgi:hypothetical protein